MIVGPMKDEDGNSTGAKYPRGMGDQYDGSASPFLYTDPKGDTYVYVGTFDAVFDSIFDLALGRGYESMFNAMHPAKIYRFDEDDNWEMVVGNPDLNGPIKANNSKIGNYFAGFSTDKESSVYSPNLYMWRMAEYNGGLFVGTLDPTPLLDILVPPFKVNFENIQMRIY